MLHKGNTGSKLLVNGFTINPIKDHFAFKNILMGFFDYDYLQTHVCDFSNDSSSKHVNKLKKPITEPAIYNIHTNDMVGIIGTVIFENGYYTLRVLYNRYPAEIQFDLYLDEEIEDPGLIIDHLCAPSIPFDGMGMFDYTYSVNNINKRNSLISDEYNNPRYHINYDFDLDKFFNETNYSVILNQLSPIHCHFCDRHGRFFGFHEGSRMVVTVCEEHLSTGYAHPQEPGHGSNKDVDQRFIRDYLKQFVKIVDTDEQGKKISKHIKGE